MTKTLLLIMTQLLFVWRFLFYIPLSAIILTKSLILHENPHSLSYQENTFIILLSMTFVNSASKIEEWGLPLKSTDTHSSSQYWSIPFNFPSAAFFIALLISAS